MFGAARSTPPGRAGAFLTAWAVLLIGSVTWPFLLVFPHPERALALRDMMVLPRPYLTHASLGFGDLPGRNAPQDAVLAVLGSVAPATWWVTMLVLGAAGTAAWSGALAGSRATGSAWGCAAAMTVAVWNPFVVERLVQGQWSVAAAAWLLPAVALCRGPGKILAMWGASLTPTGGLLALITGLLTSCGRGRWLIAVAGGLACAPWALSGALAALSPGQNSAGTASAASAAAFAPRAEAHVGTLGSLAGLGGIWNGEAVPASREAGFAVFGIALLALLAIAVARRMVPRALLILAAIGFAVPIISWLVPGLTGWVTSTVPGAGLLRDSQKFLALALPAFVAAAASLGRSDARLAGAALLCALLQAPDAPRAVAPLAPAQISVPDVDHGGRDVFFLGRPTLVDRGDGLPVVDPATKAMNVVESGELVVDGVVVDAPSPHWRAANELFGDGPLADDAYDPAVAHYYSDPQVGLVVHPDGRVEDTGIPARERRPLGIALLTAWFAVPLVVFAARRRGASAGAAS